MVDGSLDFSSGVNSYVVTTVQSARNPNGLKRTQLSWMNNATVRGGGILQRTGWLNNGTVKCKLGQYQGSFMYHPTDDSDPYLIVSIAGILYRVDVDHPDQAEDLTGGNPDLFNPPNEEVAYFEQAEQFLVIQAGDYVTLPLFWDGSTLRRSRGLLGGAALATTTPAITYPITLTNVDSPIGTAFPDQSSNSNPLGVPYTGFTAPAPGLGTPLSDVVVTAQAPYAGNLNDPITYTINTVYGTMDFVLLQTSPTVLWRYRNVSIPPGTLVPAQFVADPFFAGHGWNFPAFTAPGPMGTATIDFTNLTTAPYLLGMAGTSFTSTTVYHFTVAAITTDQNGVQANVSEIPAAGPMTYYMNRLWYAQGIQFSAGDIVGGTFGTAAYGRRDSVLKVTENPLSVGGDGFTVPAGSGNIRCLTFNANQNSALGQGQLIIATREEVFAMTVPITRSDWIGANTNNGPLMTVIQLGNGMVNQRSVVAVNGDLFFQSLEPSIRSLTTAVRYFDQWGNTPISINENRILVFNDRALMHFSSGILFDNRVLQCVLPFACPVGVAHRAMIPLNFDVISTLETKLPPVWEGMYEGLDILELMTGDFRGRQRAFAMVWSEKYSSIQLWELTDYSKFENDDGRVEWYIETPAFTWGDEFMLKKLVSAELWLDKLLGTVFFQMDYRPNGQSCWFPWHKWKLCTAKNACEDVHNPEGCSPYPEALRESFRQTITLPKPPVVCEPVMGQPAHIGNQFQCRLSIKGWVRIRGLLLHAEKVEQKLYSNMVCESPDTP